MRLPGWASTAPLPPVWSGRRRVTTGWLVAVGSVQGLAAVGVGFAISQIAETRGFSWIVMAGLAVAALALGGLRLLETLLAERLGQQYVVDVRHKLLFDALGPNRSPNVGITIARATNDLAAVSQWVSLGIARVMAGIPLLLGVLVAVALLSPAIFAAVTACLVVLLVVLSRIAPIAFRRHREMRKRRGRMASFVADTVRAAPGIRAAGGVGRELKTVDKLSEKVADSAVSAASMNGAMRGAAAVATTAVLVIAMLVAASTGMDAAATTTTLLLVSILSAPVGDLGRVVELRQGFNAARVVLAPIVSRADTLEARSTKTSTKRSKIPSCGQVHIGGILGIPELIAEPGARVELNCAEQHQTDQVLDALLGADIDVYCRIDGKTADLSNATVRRAVLGYVDADGEIEQGTVARAVRYRQPNSKEPIEPVLEALKLADRIEQLPKGPRTKLRRGGEPLNVQERTRLLIARAMYAEPAILVLKDISQRLGPTCLATVRDVVASYPGVVIICDDDASAILDHTTPWPSSHSRRVVMASDKRPLAPAHAARTPGPIDEKCTEDDCTEELVEMRNLA